MYIYTVAYSDTSSLIQFIFPVEFMKIMLEVQNFPWIVYTTVLKYTLNISTLTDGGLLCIKQKMVCIKNKKISKLPKLKVPCGIFDH